MSKEFYEISLPVAMKKDGSYIHIRDIDETNKNDLYYCPCCKGIVKPRSLKEENKMQPHFYHSEGNNCDSETIYHWLYKNWLFNQGSKFIINTFYATQ